jgi:hypothetical protein
VSVAFDVVVLDAARSRANVALGALDAVALDGVAATGFAAGRDVGVEVFGVVAGGSGPCGLIPGANVTCAVTDTRTSVGRSSREIPPGLSQIGVGGAAGGRRSAASLTSVAVPVLGL